MMVTQKAKEKQLYIIPRAWLFDVDGVITNPTRKIITEKGIIDAIAQRLNEGEIITLNSGRSLSWMMDRVIEPIMKVAKNKNQFSNFLAIGEKGGTWLSFQNKEWKTHIDKTINIPESLKSEIRILVNKEFQNSMFYDESKSTMISVEMIDGQSLSEFTQQQQALVDKIKYILKSQVIALEIDPTTIATDIQNSRVGKNLSARRVANWLKEKGFEPQRILAIGDSQSDTKMAEELQDEYSLEFIFVGDPLKLNVDKLKNKPTFTTKRFDKGTLEFLQSI